MRCSAVAAALYLVAGHARSWQLPITDYDFRTCSLIRFQLPEIVSFPGEERYESSAESYWASSQREARSACRISVESSDDVQKALYLISLTKTDFAIKSGGHSTVHNTSNVDGGAVADLALLNHVTVNSDALTIDIGMGARWIDVYSELEKFGTSLAIAGARAGSVGVGGYVLGGGLSIYSSDSGFACDQVLLFEAVLANGTILEASQDSYPDLFRALKGGGSNFAIVTRIVMRLARRPPLNVVTLQYQVSEATGLIKSLSEYNVNAAQESGSAALSLGSDGHYTSISLVLTHADVMTCIGFQPFFKIPHQIISNNIWSQKDLAQYYDDMNESGFRQYRSTLTIRNNHKLLTSVAQEALRQLTSFVSTLRDPSARAGFLVQPIPLSQLKAGEAMGGNMLGLQNESVPLVLLLIEVRYSSSHKDEHVRDFVKDLVNRISENAKNVNALHGFRYLNYASADTDVFKHIRESQSKQYSWSNVTATRFKYDKDNVFGRQIKDPFRISA